MKKLFLAVMLLTALITIAHAANQVTVVNDSKHGSVNFSGADTADVSSLGVYTSTPVELQGRRTVFVGPTTSASGATVKVGIAVGNWDANSNTWTQGPFWVQSAILTADSTIKSNGNYVVPGAELPTGGWTHFQLHIDSLSTGTCVVGWSAY